MGGSAENIRSRIPFARFFSIAAMKRARRWLVSAFLIASLLLFAATIFMWVRGYSRLDVVGWKHLNWNANRRVILEYSLDSVRGGFHISLEQLNGSGKLSANSLLDALTWELSPGFYAGSASLVELDHIYSGRVSYSFPDSPRMLGFQFARPFKLRFAAIDVWTWDAAIPYWFPASIFLFIPSLRFASYFKRRRRKVHGLYINCGYDLRATPNQCPECGALTKEPASFQPPRIP